MDVLVSPRAHTLYPLLPTMLFCDCASSALSCCSIVLLSHARQEKRFIGLQRRQGGSSSEKFLGFRLPESVMESRDSTQQSHTAIANTMTPPLNAKQTRPATQPVHSHSVARRLQTELMSLMTSGDPGVSAFPDGDNIFSWIGTIKGSPGTVYQGLSYKLSLRFPTDYPFKPPLVKFETMCFHPNVDQYGNICLDILQDKWSSAYDVRTILLSIQSLLGEPNNDSPLNSYAAALWSNQEDYKKVMHKQYQDATSGAFHH